MVENDEGRGETAQPNPGSRLRRQQPGAMGLGTSEAVPRRADGWVPPKKPDPMTSNTRGRSGRR